MRVRLLIKGNVQGVGFRALVKQVARSMAVNGVVRNLPDGSVEIHCEGTESLLESFQRRLRYEGDPENPFSLHVQSIEIHSEGEDGYGNPPDTWEPLDIDYGDSLTTFEREMIERTELGALLLVGTRTETGRVGEKVDRVGEGVDGMRGDVNRSFGEIIDRYDTFAERMVSLDGRMESFDRTLRELKDDIHRLVEHLLSREGS